jgi:DNA-binding SARP family transcriptional activator
MPKFHFRLLGGFELTYGDAHVGAINAPRLQTLLAYLLLHRSCPQSRRHLAFLFWPDSTEAQARTNLRHLLYELQHALPDADRCLLADTQRVQWRPDGPYTLDVADFEAAVAAGDQAALQQAVELYRGDLLPDCYDNWIQPERDRLRRAYRDSLERLIALTEDARDLPAALTYAELLLRHDPLHETAYRHLMRLHALNGDRAAALHIYQTCVTVLRHELGAPPAAATRMLYERLLQDETAAVISETRPVAASFPLVGRAAEWAQLQAIWRRAAAGRPQMALIVGEAGIGKTRLAEELVALADRQGALASFARGYAAEGELPYAAVTAWLRGRPLRSLAPIWLTELARLLPELLVAQPALPPPASLTEAWQRNRLFEALARGVLCDRRPQLLVLDDLHWCDRDTVEWLHYLLRFAPHAPLLIVATLRTGEYQSPELAALLASLRRDGLLTEIELGPLDARATATLAGCVAGRPLTPALDDLLFRGSEGNPLFVVEMVQAGLAQGDADERMRSPAEYARAMTAAPRPLPAKVRQVIERRLAQLSPAARELAELAATIGRQFSFDVLRAAAELTEEALVRSLDELGQRRIIREQGDGAYDFSHDKIRETAYAALSAARRRLLHRRVAEALVRLHAADTDAVSGQIGYHYELAGLIEPALAHYRRAAEAAQQVYANADAIQYYRRMLVLLGDPTPQDRAVAALLWERLGDILYLTGQHEPARAAYRQALVNAATRERAVQADLFRKLGNAWRDAREYGSARQAYDEALRILDGPPTAGGVAADAAEADDRWRQVWLDLQLDLIYLLYWQNQTAEATAMLATTRATIEVHGSVYQRVRFFIWSALIGLRRDRFMPSAATHADLQAALAAAQEAALAQTIPFIAFQLGFLLLWHGALAQAAGHLQTALHLAERSGDLPLQARSLAYLTIVARLGHAGDEVARNAAALLEIATAAQMPEYIAVARANQAWLAWRQGRLDAVQTHGQAALDLWADLPFGYLFEWLARWPLMAAALTQEQIAQAAIQAQCLLHPTQQRLADDLTAALEAACSAAEAGQSASARNHLQAALDLAQAAGQL